MKKRITYFTIACLSVTPLLLQAQNVGVGTQIPTYPFTVKDSLGSGKGIAQVSSDGQTAVGTFVSNGNAYIQTHTNTDLKFATNDQAYQMILQKGTGNVGIGSVVPTQKLEVGGAVKIGNTATGTGGTIRYQATDTSMEAYTGTGWKSMINDFAIVGQDNNGGPLGFSSMTRNAFVNLPNLTYTIKKSGYYLVLLTASGTGIQEKNDIYNFSDNREDYEGEIRLSMNNSPGAWYLRKTFFYTHYDAADATQNTTWAYHSDDGEKSLIQYFDAGTVIQVNAYIQQVIGTNAPAQQLPWSVSAQVKYVLLR
jgi:hypothetical protein